MACDEDEENRLHGQLGYSSRGKNMYWICGISADTELYAAIVLTPRSGMH